MEWTREAQVDLPHSAIAANFQAGGRMMLRPVVARGIDPQIWRMQDDKMTCIEMYGGRAVFQHFNAALSHV